MSGRRRQLVEAVAAPGGELAGGEAVGGEAAAAAQDEAAPLDAAMGSSAQHVHAQRRLQLPRRDNWISSFQRGGSATNYRIKRAARRDGTGQRRRRCTARA